MDMNSHARDAQLRAFSIYQKRPDRAQVINKGAAELHDGLGCTYEQDGHRISIDMPVAIGGGAEAPSPGYFGRAAVCSCLAIGIKMAATRENIRLVTVRVGIEQDWDNRGVLAMDGASPVASDTRIEIDITSPHAEQEIKGLVARTLEKDPWFLTFRDAQPVTSVLSINGGLD